MTIGQLWFGWAEEGVEGLNKQQIIAASGILGDRSQPLTQQVLAACYLPRAPAFGWLHGRDLRIAFRRTPTGLDGLGRPGNFFVHALAAAPEALPPQALGRLYGASIWRREAPVHPHPKLDALADLEALGLAPSAKLDAEQLITVLAGHLANLAHGAFSALEDTGERAAAFAAGIAGALPVRFGLRGFSTDEPVQQAHHYDLVAGEPPSGRFALISPDGPVTPRWRAAAELLVAARRGDTSAAAAVDAIAEQATSHQAFANALHGWTLLDRRPMPGELSDARASAAALTAVAREPRLALRLVAGPGADAVARAFVDGRPEAASIIATARAHSTYGVLGPALASALAELDPARAARLVDQLLSLAPPVAIEVAEGAVARWSARGELATLTSADAAAVAGVLAASGSELAGKAAAMLLSEPAFAAILATSARLPTSWRAHAIATCPGAVAPAELARLLTRQRRFAEALLSAPDRRVLDAVSTAVAEVPSSIALEAINAAAPYVTPFEADEWRWSVMVQTRDSLHRYHELRLLLLRRHRPMPTIWAERVLDTFVSAILEGREKPLPLLSLDGTLLADVADRRAASWRELLRALRPHNLVVNAAIEAANAIHSLGGRDRDAALETTVDAIFDRCQDLAQLRGALGALSTRTRADAFDISLRLARASARPRGRDMSGPWVASVRWLTDTIRSGAAPEHVLNEPVVASLGGAPFVSDELDATIGLLRAGVDGPRSLRRWLGHLTQPSNSRSRFRSKR